MHHLSRTVTTGLCAKHSPSVVAAHSGTRARVKEKTALALMYSGNTIIKKVRKG